MPGGDVEPGKEAWLGISASRTPASASLTTYGIVAFVSAYVEVTGTAPGMFATQ